MNANKKNAGDCDTCKIASTANCTKCTSLMDYRWVKRDGFKDIEWEDVPDKTGSLE